MQRSSEWKGGIESSPCASLPETAFPHNLVFSLWGFFPIPDPNLEKKIDGGRECRQGKKWSLPCPTLYLLSEELLFSNLWCESCR